MNEQETEKLQPILARMEHSYPYADIGPGWYELVLELDRQIAELAPDYDVVQVKEKFGGLRYYISNYGTRADGKVTPDSDDAAEAINKLILDAELKSFTMCEMCGQPGVLRTGGWMKTLCDEHSNGRAPAHFDPGV